PRRRAARGRAGATAGRDAGRRGARERAPRPQRGAARAGRRAPVTRLAALLLTALTGSSGLVYEVTWQKYLATLLGSQSEATAAILAIFLRGLSLGYSLFGRVTQVLTAPDTIQRRIPSLFFTYGIVETAIGVRAFAFPLLF